MTSRVSLEKIKGMISKAENPLYLYDDDADGLCSFLLLKRRFKKGDGMPVKTAPKLGISFLENIKAHSFDLLVILDKPIVEQELIDKIDKPIVYIDHHPIQDLKGIYYFNPRMKNKKDSSATTKICHDIVKQDEWLAAIGIIADWQLPRFLKNLEKKYPDLIENTKEPPEIMFRQKFGKLTRIFSAALKGNSAEVKKCVSVLEQMESPYDVLNNPILNEVFEKNYKIYYELLDRALKEKHEGNLLVFSYASDKFSFTGELANELLYKFPKGYIIVAREKDNEMRLSVRGDNARKCLEKALIGINGYGGGHDRACGGAIKKHDFTKFLDNFRSAIRGE